MALPPKVAAPPVPPRIEQYRGSPLADFLDAFLTYTEMLGRYIQDQPDTRSYFWAKATGAIAAGASGNCTMYADDDTTLTSDVVSVKNPWPTGNDIPINAKVLVLRDRNRYKAGNWNCS
jgi:hypothetical protein